MGVDVYTDMGGIVTQTVNDVATATERMAGQKRRTGRISTCWIEQGQVEQVAPALIIGPMNRGVEIDSAIADDVEKLIHIQVEVGVTARMACLEAVSAGPRDHYAFYNTPLLTRHNLSMAWAYHIADGKISDLQPGSCHAQDYEKVTDCGAALAGACRYARAIGSPGAEHLNPLIAGRRGRWHHRSCCLPNTRPR